MKNAPGRGLLRFSGILFIIFGVIAGILGLLAMFGGGLVAAQNTTLGALGTVAAIAGIAVIISAAFNIIVGIIGVRNADRPEKATTCIVWGIICLVIQICSVVMNGSFQWTSFVGFILPVLFVIGAFKNKNVA